MSEYKRFTKKDKYGHWYTDTKMNDRFMWSTDGKIWERDLTHCAFDGEAIDRLAELEDKLESGQLVDISNLPQIGMSEEVRYTRKEATYFEELKRLFIKRMTEDSETKDRRRKDFNQAIFSYYSDDYIEEANKYSEKYNLNSFKIKPGDTYPVWDEITMDMVLQCFDDAVKDWLKSWCDGDNRAKK